MPVFYTTVELKNHLNPITLENKTIGFVPTMGALHIGHISLVEKSISQNDFTVVSIFVNPTQFNNKGDLNKYPRTLEDDINLLHQKSKKIIVFNPSPEDLYNHKITSTKYNFDGLENVMEGKHRPGHFDGVGTVLSLLFNAVKPNRAYFGEKDFQQLQIVKKLIEIQEIPIEIIGCEIYREANGLAFSSRNQRLSDKAKKEASIIFETLNKVKQMFGTKNANDINEFVIETFNKQPEFDLEYFEIAEIETLKTAIQIDTTKKCRAFIAVFVEQVRLIDNIALN